MMILFCFNGGAYNNHIIVQLGGISVRVLCAYCSIPESHVPIRAPPLFMRAW